LQTVTTLIVISNYFLVIRLLMDVDLVKIDSKVLSN
jgi:hypothetical protein